MNTNANTNVRGNRRVAEVSDKCLSVYNTSQVLVSMMPEGVEDVAGEAVLLVCSRLLHGEKEVDGEGRGGGREGEPSVRSVVWVLLKHFQHAE